MNDTKRDPFRLSGLPRPALPDADPWPAIADRLRRRQRRRTGVWAMAAAVTLALVMTWQIAPPRGASESGPLAGPTAADGFAAAPASGPDPSAEALASLMSLSQHLETRLRLMRGEAGALPTGALVYQVEIWDLVAQVDDALSRQPDSTALWSQRINLLLDLNQLYRQELRRDEGDIASL